MRPGESTTPPGMRIYAIGDVHGCDGLLESVHQSIAADLAAQPIEDFRIIHIGDYVDRGPNSAAVVERLMRLCAENERVLCLAGNHEELLLAFLDDPVGAGPTFLRFGGLATLESYGVSEPFVRAPDDLPKLRDRFLAVLAEEHRRFLRELPVFLRFGDYFFCHAGIRPGVPLDQQERRDLLWIREEFLRDRNERDVVVVHGHSPVAKPLLRINSIAIDTGAFATGELTCLALEGKDYWFL